MKTTIPVGPSPRERSEQRDLIKPITKKLTIIYVPKVIHPWYDVVHDGAKFAVEEFKKQGIDIDVVWDAPPQANIDDQNRRIEAAIGRRPDALCVASLDPSTNAQILEEAKKAGLNVMTFDTFCDERFRTSATVRTSRTAMISASCSRRRSEARAKSASFRAA